MRPGRFRLTRTVERIRKQRVSASLEQHLFLWERLQVSDSITPR
jgi:hypothetical protein